MHISCLVHCSLCPAVPSAWDTCSLVCLHWTNTWPSKTQLSHGTFPENNAPTINYTLWHLVDSQLISAELEYFSSSRATTHVTLRSALHTVGYPTIQQAGSRNQTVPGVSLRERGSNVFQTCPRQLFGVFVLFGF